MSDMLKEWVRNIFIMMLVISLIDIILPSSNMRKYVKFILSIIFIAVILHPLMDFKNIKVDNIFTVSAEAGYQTEEELGIENVENIQRIQIVDLYKHKVKDEIQLVINEHSPEAIVQDIKVTLYENANKKNFGDIHSIDITLVNKLESNNEKSIIDGIASRINVSRSKVKIRFTE